MSKWVNPALGDCLQEFEPMMSEVKSEVIIKPH